MRTHLLTYWIFFLLRKLEKVLCQGFTRGGVAPEQDGKEFVSNGLLLSQILINLLGGDPSRICACEAYYEYEQPGSELKG